ncbi:uncharacterized protein si:ch211-106e7.2 [Notolabrus celidotus]|uniref:uncharacterized protein si:ch211-106e7.2 n=1 Tax=Notolabrus celidotus TaxID=1203425 RepID=UPI0014905FAE|nr:uncharacterized protein si:ch211-106e7.2 [Notolabrus celidotus]
MDSCAWMNGWCQQVGPSMQSSQPAAWHIQDSMRTCQTSYPYRTSNTGAPPPQGSQRWNTNWQASADRDEAISSKQTSAGIMNHNYWNVNGNFQSGNPHLMANNGSRFAAQQGLPQNYPQNSLAKAPSIMGTAKMQSRFIFQNVDMGSAYNTAATSFPYEQVTRSDKLVSSTAHNLNHRRNSIQDGFFSSVPPPDYITAASQSLRNKSKTINSLSSQHIFSTQPTQQNHAQANYSGCYDSGRSSRTHGLPLNSSDEAREQVIIARIAEDLHKSVTAELDGRSSAYQSAYSGNQFVSQDGVTKSNHCTEPAVNNNSYSLQSSPFSSAQSLSKTTHAAAHHSMGVSPLQNSNSIYSRAAEAGMAANAVSLSKKGVYPFSVKLQGMLGAVGQGMSSDSSVHSSPGCIGTRAVAVVQPLSQESHHQNAREHTSFNMKNQLTECTATDESLCKLQRRKQAKKERQSKTQYKIPEEDPEKPKQTTFNKSETSASSASNEWFSDSAAALTQKQLTEPELDANTQVVEHVSPAAEETAAAEVPVSQSGDKDKTVNPTDPPERVVKLSSIPTIQCTHGTVRNIIHKLTETYQDHIRRSSGQALFSGEMLIQMFWNDDPKASTSCMQTPWFIELLTKVQAFCQEHVTKDTVIMSGVDEASWKALEGHHILKHEEVYTEPPYQPFWLNDNEKLDDIEREFGLPWPLRRRSRTLESDFQLDQAEVVDSISDQIISEVSNMVLSQTEHELVNVYGEKAACTVETVSTLTNSAGKKERDNSSDPFGALEIKVLPQEEALLIHEQTATGAKIQSERGVSSSAGAELQEVINVTLNDSSQDVRVDSPIEQVCCNERFKEIIYGHNMALSECKCQSEKNPNKNSDGAFEEEEKGELKSADSKFHSMQGENPVKDGESINTQTVIYVKTIDSMEIGGTDSNQPSSEDTVDGLLSCENRTPEQVEEAQARFTGRKQSNGLELSTSESKNLSPGVTDWDMGPLSCSDGEGQISDQEDSFGQAQLTSTDVGESLPRTREEAAQTIATPALRTIFNLSRSCEKVEGKQKTLNSQVGFLHSLNKSKRPFVMDALSESKKSLTDVKESESSSSKYGTVKLALFGSTQHARYNSALGLKSQNSATGAEAKRITGPPEVLSVSLRPLKRKLNESVPTGEPSVKLQIYEKWRKSLPPTQIRYKGKLKSQKFLSSSGASLKKSERDGSLKQPIFSERRIWNVKTVTERGRLLSNGPKYRKEKAKTGRKRQGDVVAVRHHGNRHHTDPPQQENIILKFSVLPTTFNFEDEPHETKTPNNPAPDETEEDEGKSSVNTFTREKGSWNKHAEKKYCPLRQSSGLFQEFQKKYKKLRQQD